MKNKGIKITAFIVVIALFASIVGYSIYLFAQGREERVIEWGGADKANILDDSVPESYSLPFGKGSEISYSGPDNWYSAASLSQNLPVYEEIERVTGITFKWDVLPSDQWNQNMKVRLSSSSDKTELPDIMGLPAWGSADINTYAKDKIIIPLNELINKYAPNIKRILKENPSIRKQMTAADGNIYTIDEFFEANHYYKSVIVRKDWLEKCGYPQGWVPKTKAEFVDVLKKFRDTPSLSGTDPKNTPIPLCVSEAYLYDIFCSGFGLSAPLEDTVCVDGKVFYQRATPEYGQFVEWMSMLREEELLYKGYEATGNTFEQLVIKNRVGMTVAAGDTMDRLNELLNERGIDAEYILINPPVDDNGNIKLSKRMELGGQTAISIDCEDPITAIRLIDFMWGSREGLVLTHYGIEGTSYVKDAEGKLQFTDFVTNNPKKFDKATALRSIGAWGPVLDHQTLEFMQSVYSAQANEYYTTNLNNGVYVDPYPKILPTAEEAEKTGKLSSDLTVCQEEWHRKKILGKTSETFEEYLAQMEKLGLRDYEKYRGEQYERFNKL